MTKNINESEDPIIPSFFWVKPDAPPQYRGPFVLGVNFGENGFWETTRAKGDGPAAQGIKLNYPLVIPDISEEAEQEILSVLEKEESTQKEKGRSLNKSSVISALQDLGWLR